MASTATGGVVVAAFETREGRCMFGKGECMCVCGNMEAMILSDFSTAREAFHPMSQFQSPYSLSLSLSLPLPLPLPLSDRFLDDFCSKGSLPTNFFCPF